MDGKGDSFFKVFMPKFMTERLLIPPAFIPQMQGQQPGKGFIRDRYENMWPVEIVKINNEFFFQEGWEIFVRANLVTVGDILIFKYLGRGLFSIILMGKTACEKKGVGHRIFDLNKDEDTNEENEKNEEHDYNEDEEDKEDEKKNKEHDYNEDEEDKEEEEEKESDNEGEEELQDKPFEGGASSSKSKGSRRAKRKHSRQSQCGHQAAKAVKVEDAHVAQLFDSGVIPRPENPYFVTKVKRGRPNDLYIPFEFWNNLPAKAILRDPSGREWPAELKWWEDGRPWYRKAWGSLCRFNLLKANDKCLCELIRGREGNEGLTIQVSFIRAGEDAQN